MATVTRLVSSISREAAARLGDDEIHVWSARLDAPVERVRQLERKLAADERTRSPQRRLSRAVLRHVLAAYAGVAPEDLGISGSLDVRPSLSGPCEGGPVHFNLSHSGTVLLIAVARTPHLGIDVERLRPVARLETVARRALSVRERQCFERLPAPLRREAFLRAWTRKEACVKASGQGVWSAFRRWEVSIGPAERPEVRMADGDRAEARRWSLFHLDPAPGYLGALAVKGTGWTLRTRTFHAAENVR